MNRLESARLRFLTALDALEQTINERLQESHDSVSSSAELELLKSERERLYARIAALENQSRDLAGLTQEVEGRLDGAIAELRQTLGRH